MCSSPIAAIFLPVGIGQTEEGPGGDVAPGDRRVTAGGSGGRALTAAPASSRPRLLPRRSARRGTVPDERRCRGARVPERIGGVDAAWNRVAADGTPSNCIVRRRMNGRRVRPTDLASLFIPRKVEGLESSWIRRFQVKAMEHNEIGPLHQIEQLSITLEDSRKPGYATSTPTRMTSSRLRERPGHRIPSRNRDQYISVPSAADWKRPSVWHETVGLPGMTGSPVSPGADGDRSDP